MSSHRPLYQALVAFTGGYWGAALSDHDWKAVGILFGAALTVVAAVWIDRSQTRRRP